MKSILVIGLGRFGKHIAMKFSDLGNEVMVVDEREEKVNGVLPFVTNGQIGDCTNEQVLRSLGVRNFDLCVVAIGNNFQASLEITSLLKELGAAYVLSKASRDRQAKFLLRNGADNVVYAEREMAEKLALRYSANNIFDFIDLTPEYSIFETPVPKSWVGKTIEQNNVRKKHHLNILAIKQNNEISPLPKADYILSQGDHLIMMGHRKDIISIN